LFYLRFLLLSPPTSFLTSFSSWRGDRVTTVTVVTLCCPLVYRCCPSLVSPHRCFSFFRQFLAPLFFSLVRSRSLFSRLIATDFDSESPPYPLVVVHLRLSSVPPPPQDLSVPFSLRTLPLTCFCLASLPCCFLRPQLGRVDVVLDPSPFPVPPSLHSLDLCGWDLCFTPIILTIPVFS